MIAMKSVIPTEIYLLKTKKKKHQQGVKKKLTHIHKHTCTHQYSMIQLRSIKLIKALTAVSSDADLHSPELVQKPCPRKEKSQKKITNFCFLPLFLFVFLFLFLFLFSFFFVLLRLLI